MSPRWWDVPGPGDEQAPCELEVADCGVCRRCDGCSVCGGAGQVDGLDCAACEGSGCEDVECGVAEHERLLTRGDDEAWRAQIASVL